MLFIPGKAEISASLHKLSGSYDPEIILICWLGVQVKLL